MEVEQYEILASFRESIPPSSKGWMEFFANHRKAEAEMDGKELDEELPAEVQILNGVSYVVSGVFETLLVEGVLVTNQERKDVLEDVDFETVRFAQDFETMEASDQNRLAELLWEISRHRFSTSGAHDFEEAIEDYAFAEILAIFKTHDIVGDARMMARSIFIERANADFKAVRHLSSEVARRHGDEIRAFGIKSATVGRYFEEAREVFEAYHEAAERKSAAFGIPGSSQNLQLYLAKSEGFGPAQLDDGEVDRAFNEVLLELVELLKTRNLMQHGRFSLPFVLEPAELETIDEALMRAIKDRRVAEAMRKHGAWHRIKMGDSIPEAENPLEEVADLIFKNITITETALSIPNNIEGDVAEEVGEFIIIASKFIRDAMNPEHTIFDEALFDRLSAARGKKWAYQEMAKAYNQLGRFDLLLETTVQGLAEFHEDLILAQSYVIALCHLGRTDDAQDFILSFAGEENKERRQFLFAFLRNTSESERFGFSPDSEKLAAHFLDSKPLEEIQDDGSEMAAMELSLSRTHAQLVEAGLLVDGEFTSVFTLSREELEELDELFEAVLQSEIRRNKPQEERILDGEVLETLLRDIEHYREHGEARHTTSIGLVVEFFRKKVVQK